MRRILHVLFAATLTAALAACALLQATSTEAEGMKAARVVLTAYADFVQPAILTYGQLQATEAAATSSVAAASGVLDGTTVDTGQIAQAIADITAAQAAFTTARGN